ncbi:MAG: hypothetical protein WDN24_15250 [Sphingomonas sp.]
MARLIPLVASSLAATIATAGAAWADGGARLGGGGALDISLTRVVLALLLCLMLAALAALLLKRGGGRIDLAALRRLAAKLPVERRIQVIETRRISQHADLCLLRCDGEEYLILCSAQQQSVLRRTPAGEGAAAA